MITYSDLLLLSTFEERLEFLKTRETPSEITFANLRFLNQAFYNSRGWRETRKQVIARDLGYDLAIPGRDIYGKTIVHHMNPLRPKDLLLNTEQSLNPEFLITVSNSTHQAIHFDIPQVEPSQDRYPGDTNLW